jgi:eukaryotic-like serine/threonine-protein kinase
MEPLGVGDPRVIGGYRLLGLLGIGGMGRVFLGRAADGSPAAIKVINPERVKDAEFLKRFQREARMAESVNGRYIAPVLKAGVDDSPPWLATAFIAGPTLGEAIAAGPLPTGAVWRLADALVQALQAVHSRGLVHRDLKPENVLLASDGPKLIDFGIAKVATGGSTITMTGVGIGTPAFMSPEQFLGPKVGPESDVFSLGSLLAFAASGAQPFGGGALVEVAFRVAGREPDLSGVIPGDLRALIARCLAKAPGDRPSLSQVRAAVASGLASVPLPSWTGSFWPDPLAAMVSRREASDWQYLAPGPAVAPPSPDGPPMPGPRFAPHQPTVTIHPRPVPPRAAPPGRAARPAGARGPGGGAAAVVSRASRRRLGRHSEATRYAAKGDRLAGQWQFSQAEDAYRESIRHDPSDPAVHNDLGWTLCQLDRLLEAEQQFRRALKIAPDYDEARKNLCLTLHTMYRYSDLADACDEASRLGACCQVRRPPAGPGRA